MVYAPKKTAALTIDRNQAELQLKLLGYKSGDNVYMRFFVPDTDPRYGTPEAARKADKLNWEQAEQYQNDGYGVYFVINGGGHKDKDVKVGRALFCEWDDRPIEEQILAWQELNLLEPSMQVCTRKSVHNYWRADLTREQWTELQQDLLVYTRSDQQLKNLSRVMRLAGAWHIKTGCEPVRCDIIHQSDKVYSYQELRAAIPRRQEPEQPAINYQPSTSDDVPLYQFLTKDDRALIDQGATQGSRNSSGAKLARNLIGTVQRLNHLGIRFSDDPRHLFHDYCHRCNPSISYSEAEAIWKSAEKDNPTASLTDEALENCAKAWLRNQEKASERGFTSGNRRSVGGGSSGDGGDRPSVVGNATYQKPSIREAIAKAEQILKARFNAQLDSIEASILLEELRQEAGVNDYNWERKYLKPLREKLERSLALPVAGNQPTAQPDPSERLRLDLLALIKETDPIKKVRKRAEIASHYRISKGEIEFLCRTLDGDSKTPKAQFFALDDFLNMESEGIDYLIPGLLPRGETVLCSGLPKSGKTLLAIDAAFAIGTGESHFLGEEVQQGKVLLVSVDESPQSTRAKLLKRGFRSRDAENIAVMTAWDISQLDALEAKLEDFRPNLVVIDSLKRITAGREISENSAEFADIIYTLKEILTKYSAAGILIHHSNKNPEATGVSRVRGSTAIAGAVWGIWQMDIPESANEDESGGKPKNNNKKQKRFDPTNPNRIFTAICRDTEGALLNIRFNPENHSYSISDTDETVREERKTQEQIILEILAQVSPKGLTGREIMNYSGLSRSVYSVLDRMVSKRLITHRQSNLDSRMTVYCLPKRQGTHTPPQSYSGCDQYSPESTPGICLNIDHTLITSHRKIDHNLAGDRTHVINPNSQPVDILVEMDHKNTSQRGEGVSSNPVTKLSNGSITPKSFSDIDDPWEDESTQPDVVVTTSEEIVSVPSQAPTTAVENASQAAVTVEDEETPQPLRETEVEDEDEATMQGAVVYLINVESWAEFTDGLEQLGFNEEQKTELKRRLAEVDADKVRQLYATRPLVVGDRVNWTNCPAHCENLAPFEITSIDSDYAKLDLFEKPVPLSELERA